MSLEQRYVFRGDVVKGVVAVVLLLALVEFLELSDPIGANMV